MVYLLVTNKRDITCDFVVRELRRRDLPFHRLNTETMPGMSVCLTPQSAAFDIRRADGTWFRVADVSAAYFRRPDAPVVDGLSGVAADYSSLEWTATLKSLYLMVGDRWLSHPSAIMLAEDKPSQLAIAARCGLRTPSTLISNDPDEISRFVEAAPSIVKPLRQSLVKGDDKERVIFTNRIDRLDEADFASVRVSPAIYQHEISKRYDLRATVVGTRVFSTAIHSQSFLESEVDWRHGSNPDLKHEIVTLPSDIEAACVEVVKALGLRFGAIDLVEDRVGQFWFLECNPNGQWAWIETRTGHPIAAAIVDELEEISRCSRG